MLWVALPLQVGLIIFAKPFLTLWMGSRYAESSYPTLVILAAPLALYVTHTLGVRLLYGTGRLAWFSRAMMIEAAVNLGLSVALARPFGIEGVAWGTTIPNSALCLAVMVHVCQSLEIGFLSYLREVFVRPFLLASLLAFGWAVVTSVVIPPRTWSSLLGTGICGVLAYGSVAVVAEFGPKLVIRIINARSRALAGELRLLVSRTAPVENRDARR